MKAIFVAIFVFSAMFSMTSAGLIGAVAPITTGVSYQHQVQTHHSLPYAVGYGGYGGYGLGYGYGAPLAAGYGAPNHYATGYGAPLAAGYGLGYGYGHAGLYKK